MTSLVVAQWVVALVGLAIAVAWARGVRAGRDPLGPAPRGDFPDMVVPLVVALAAWAGTNVAVPMLVPAAARGPAFTLCLAAIALALLPIVVSRWPRSEVPLARQVGAGVYGGIATFGIVAVIAEAVQTIVSLVGHQIPVQSVVKSAAQASGSAALLAALMAVVLAPFAEEVFYRGLLLATLARTSPPRTAITVQAVIFGLAHVIGRPEQLPLAIPLAAVGWCAGWLALRTRSIGPAILVHATFNAIQFAFIRLGAA